jgi:hypothetical protein
VLVTPDFDVQPAPLTEYYHHLEQRLGELQNLLGAQGTALPSTYEKYLHGNMPAGHAGNPVVSAKEYYEQLKQLRADSQVGERRAAGGCRGSCWGACGRGGGTAVPPPSPPIAWTASPAPCLPAQGRYRHACIPQRFLPCPLSSSLQYHAL